MNKRFCWLPLALLPAAIPAYSQTPSPRVDERVPTLTLPEQKLQPRSPAIALYTLGGTLVGAWLGYMTSQVKYSDWDRDKLDGLGERRRHYTAYGAGLGSIAGLSFSLATGPRPQQRAPVAVPGQPHGHFITRNEIAESGLANAYDLVQTLRRNWLHERGTHSMRETTIVEVGGTSLQDTQMRVTRAGDPTIVAYLNEAFLGHVDRLREIPAVTVHSIRYYDAAAATQRWGAGHTHGAIQVLTQ